MKRARRLILAVAALTMTGEAGCGGDVEATDETADLRQDLRHRDGSGSHHHRHQRIAICHRRHGEERTLIVPHRAVARHLRHGDLLGPCRPSCPRGCDDGEPCTEDSCVSGACRHAPLTGVACNDGDVCTTVDVCQGGQCVGHLPLSCMAPDACSVAACDPVLGCVVQPGPDSDGDGRPDACDNCPSNANGPDFADADGDGRGDHCDNCRATFNGPAFADRDDDFLGDACDNCPDVANVDQSNSRGYEALEIEPRPLTGSESFTRLALADDEVASIPLPAGLNFSFFDFQVTDIQVSSNGFLRFNQPLATSPGFGTPQPIPADDGFDGILAAAWGSLGSSTSPAGGVQYRVVRTGPDRELQVQWLDLPFFDQAASSPLGTITITARLFSDDHIEIQAEGDGVPGLFTRGAESFAGDMAMFLPGESRGSFSPVARAVEIATSAASDDDGSEARAPFEVGDACDNYWVADEASVAGLDREGPGHGLHRARTPRGGGGAWTDVPDRPR